MWFLRHNKAIIKRTTEGESNEYGHQKLYFCIFRAQHLIVFSQRQGDRQSTLIIALLVLT